MISLIFNKDIFKILTIFSVSPGSRFKRNELKEKTKLNNVPLDNALAKLLKTSILKKEKTLISINFENQIAKSLLEIISWQYKSLKEVPLNVYFLLIDLIDSIALIKAEVYLFGSYSKLIYNENSDVDIALIITSIDKSIISKIVNKIEKKYNKKIALHIFDKQKFYKNKKDPLIKDIIKNGVKLI